MLQNKKYKRIHSQVGGGDLENTWDFFVKYASNLFVFQNAETAEHVG